MAGMTAILAAEIEVDGDGSVNAATNSPCLRSGRRRRIWRLLVADGHPDHVGGHCAGHTPDLANGLTTFNAGGCSSCHAVPGQPDRLRLGGGLAIPSPFGTFYAPNISPDPADGIGRWTEAEFVNAVTKGISPAGFHYFPAFPYTSYQHAKVEDVRDLFAYLKTLAAVSGQGARSRRAVSVQYQAQCRDLEIAVHGRQAFRAGPSAFGAMESRRLSRERPRPLRRVSQPAKFSRRHRRRAALRGRARSGRRGLGAEHHPKGIGDWSEKDIAYFLKTGAMPDGDSAGGSMVRVIKNISQLRPEDRAAIAEYLKSLPPVDGPPRPKKAAKPDDKS